MAVGGGNRRLPRCVEEAWYGQADWEVVGPNHLGVCHAAGPGTLPLGPLQEGLVDQEGVHPVSGRVECGGHVFHPAAVAFRKPQAYQPERNCSVARLVAASM